MENKILTLIELLEERTNDQILKWKEGNDEDSVQVDFPRQSIVIEKIEYNYEGVNEVIRMKIFNENGKIIEDFNANQYNSEEKVRKIYETAKKQIYRADETIDEIISILEIPF